MATDRWSVAFFNRLIGADTECGSNPTLKAHATALAALAATFKGSPAIFNAWPVPGNVDGLYVAMSGNAGASPNDTKNSLGRLITRYIHVFDKATGSEANVENAAEHIVKLFHRQKLPISGHSVYISSAEGPISTPTGEDMTGRMVIVTLSTEEV